PQVVTFGLDYLLDQKEPIEAVHLVYLKPRTMRLQKALNLLVQTLQTEKAYSHLELVLHQIEIRETPLEDVQHTADAAQAWEFINRLITNLKRTGHHLHVLISGGRRILGLLTLSASTLQFYPDDKLWHVYTPEDLRPFTKDGQIMHLPDDSDYHLIEVPTFPIGSLFLNFREITSLDQKSAYFDEKTKRRCLYVLDRLTPRQREVLAEFANGKRPKEVAQSLFLSIHTIDRHKSKIFSLCREAWGLTPTARLDYHFLRDKFSSFF
ncbi:MAG: CRISPR-associated ring nuclease, partial [Chloroflexota bacterium]